MTRARRLLGGLLLALVAFSSAPAHAQERKPLIGIEANLERDPKTGAAVAKVAEAYLQAVRDAGGEPIVLSPLTTTVDAALLRVDGIVVTGGDDVPPERYGEKAITDAALVDPERLKFGEELLTKALERGVPVLGICFGHQLLNVIRGGKLVQDIPTLVKDAERHRRADTHEAGETRHDIRVLEDSQLFETTGGKLEVNSFHHQAVRLVGRGLRVVAKAADGVVEAVESLDPRRFVVGVQWHPEREPAGSAGRNIFSKLIAAASGYQASRTDRLAIDVRKVRDEARREHATAKDLERAREAVPRAEATGFTRLLERAESRERDRVTRR